MLRQLLNRRAAVQDIPTTLKAAAFDVIAEASAAGNDVRETAAQIAADARSGVGAIGSHARRAAAISGAAATDAFENGLQSGAQAWRDARRQAADWGSVALDGARSRPGVVLIGVAVAGLAVGFWLRGTARRAAPVPARARAARPAKSANA